MQIVENQKKKCFWCKDTTIVEMVNTDKPFNIKLCYIAEKLNLSYPYLSNVFQRLLIPQ
jgi:hypothetical protein